MVQITYTLRLDMRDTGIVNTSLRLKQGDSGMKIAVNVFNGGVSAFDSSTTPKIVFRRPDGASVMADMTVESSLYSYTLVGNELQVPGKELIDIKFPIGAEGRESTMSCSIEVVPDTITPNTHGSGIYDNDLAELVEEATEAAETVQEVVGDSEAWADGTRGGVPVGPDDPAYHNNSKYWSEQANPTRLENLTDVDLDNLTDGDILRYSSADSEWQNSDALSVAESDIDDIDDEISAICNVYGSKNLAVEKVGYSLSGSSSTGYSITTVTNGLSYIAKVSTGLQYRITKSSSNGNRFRVVGFFNEPTSTADTTAVEIVADATLSEYTFTNTAGYKYLVFTANVTDAYTLASVQGMITDARIKDRTYVPYAPTNKDCMSYAVNTKLGAHNLLNNGAVTQTLSNVTYTVNTDNTSQLYKSINIYADGTTNTSISTLSLSPSNSRYKLSDFPSRNLKASIGVGSPILLVIWYYDSGKNYLGNEYSQTAYNSTKMDIPSNAAYFEVAIRVPALTPVNNVRVYPMITTIEDTDPTYAPPAMTNRELTAGFGNVKEIRAGRFSYTNGASIAGTVTFDEPFTKGTTTVVIITGESGNTQYITLFTAHGASASGFSYIGKNITGDTTSVERYAQYIAMRF